jgi:hypothetical protein
MDNEVAADAVVTSSDQLKRKDRLFAKLGNRDRAELLVKHSVAALNRRLA